MSSQSEDNWPLAIFAGIALGLGLWWLFGKQISFAEEWFLNLLERMRERPV